MEADTYYLSAYIPSPSEGCLAFSWLCRAEQPMGERGGANLSPCVSLYVTGRHLLLRLLSSLDFTLWEKEGEKSRRPLSPVLQVGATDGLTFSFLSAPHVWGRADIKKQELLPSVDHLSFFDTLKCSVVSLHRKTTALNKQKKRSNKPSPCKPRSNTRHLDPPSLLPDACRRGHTGKCITAAAASILTSVHVHRRG